MYRQQVPGITDIVPQLKHLILLSKLNVVIFYSRYNYVTENTSAKYATLEI